MKSKSRSCVGGQPWHAQLSRVLPRGQRHHGHSSSPQGTDPALDDGPGEHDLGDYETETAIPDDDDDSVSLASCMSESV